MSDFEQQSEQKSKKGGRPSGSRNKTIRDLRPVIMKMLVKALNNRKARKEIEEYLDNLPAAERVNFYMTMARIGINASPKTTELEGGGTGISLFINGTRQSTPIDQTVDVTPSPRSLPAPAEVPHDSRVRLPYASTAERCEGLESLTRPAAVVSAPPPVPRGASIFTVPSYDDLPESRNPPEWAGPPEGFEE